MSSISRRTFLGTGAVAAGAMGIGAISPAMAEGEKANRVIVGDLHQEDVDASCVELEPITEFADEQTFDIVVVGAGVAGVPAVLTALEEGATVACLQKTGGVSANGFGFSCVVGGASNEAGKNRWMSDWARLNDWRINPTLFRHYMDHSEEAISWIIERADEVGLEFVSYSTDSSIRYDDGGVVAVCDGTTPGNQVLMTALAEKAEAEGAKFFYKTPCVQLVQEEDGTVTGAIGKTKDGSYIKLNATKGVILCCGDYMNNEPMLNRYLPDGNMFPLCLVDHTGDGHILGTLAGGRIAPLGHPRQIHTNYIGPLMFWPFLALDYDGKRFCNETIPMSSLNVAMARTYKPDHFGKHYRIFDAAMAEKYPGCVPASYVEAEIAESTNVWASANLYAKGDTLEELVANAGMPEEAVASIERWNEMCAQGRDDDFGVPGSVLKPIDTPPFYALIGDVGMSGINAGVMVDGNYQVIDANDNPIPGLYAAGIDAGNACGGLNWNMPGGFSNGGFYTAGRYSVIHALTGGAQASKPCCFDEICDRFRGPDGAFAWELDTCANAISVW